MFTACGIETNNLIDNFWWTLLIVATVFTACGIETEEVAILGRITTGSCNSVYRLRYWNMSLKLFVQKTLQGCNSVYRLRYWNPKNLATFSPTLLSCCNSTYRLRYWPPFLSLVPLVLPSKVATVHTACGIETFLRQSLYIQLQFSRCNSTYRLRYWNIIKSKRYVLLFALQQCLPLAVLKPHRIFLSMFYCQELQQCLPLVVLKRDTNWVDACQNSLLQQCLLLAVCDEGCQQRNVVTMRSAHL